MKQITYNKFGRRMGKLGNSLFQLATLTAFSKRYNRELVLPEWNYQPYFSHQIPIVERGDFKDDVNEANFHFTPNYWDSVFEMNKYKERVSISGWLQSEEYFKEYKEDVKKILTFEESFVKTIKKDFEDILENGKETIAISVRRGDYIGNDNYELLPIMYYILALNEHFPKWREYYNIIVFSDDLPYCKHHFSAAENTYFPPEGYCDIEQLCLMSLCDHFIIANSTFSWWGAWLGEKAHSKVVRPNYLFDGYLLQHSNIKDFYPNRWQVFDHKENGKTKLYPLSNVTFTIPIHYDHEDREENFKLNISTLRKYFDTNILVGEQGSEHFLPSMNEYEYMMFPEMEYFHRTKMLNDMANTTDTPIIVNWDVDVVVAPMQIIESVYQIEKEGNQMVYPYNAKMARVPREVVRNYSNDYDTGIWMNEVFRGTREIDTDSVGGAIFWDKESFIYGGMENEHFIGYGPEDVERWERYKRMGYRIHRVNGAIYHFDHYIGNTQGGNPYYTDNNNELEKIRLTDNEELSKHIASWEWANIYLPTYYSTISEKATQSAENIFAVLNFEYSNQMSSVKTILDVGCGIGEWGVALKDYEYKGVDYKIPKHLLLIPGENYKDFDLRKNKELFPFEEKFDLVICTEVMEHIEEKYAEEIVNFLCTKADRVLFSAAIPYQGGVNHVNEQWQPYWEWLFNKNEFGAVDDPLLSDILYDNDNVELWYRQNLTLFIKGGDYDHLRKYIHPQMFENIIGTITDWKRKEEQDKKLEELKRS